MASASNKETQRAELHKAIWKIADDVDVTSNKLGATLEERIERLAKIIADIRDLDFGNVRAAQIDAIVADLEGQVA